MNSTRNEISECYNDINFKSKISDYNYNIANGYEIKNTNKMDNEHNLNDNFNCTLNVENFIDSTNNIYTGKNKVNNKNYAFNSNDNPKMNINHNSDLIDYNKNSNNNSNHNISNNNNNKNNNNNHNNFMNTQLITDIDYSLNDINNSTISYNENATIQYNYSYKLNKLDSYNNDEFNITNQMVSNTIDCTNANEANLNGNHVNYFNNINNNNVDNNNNNNNDNNNNNNNDGNNNNNNNDNDNDNNNNNNNNNNINNMNKEKLHERDNSEIKLKDISATDKSINYNAFSKENATNRNGDDINCNEKHSSNNITGNDNDNSNNDDEIANRKLTNNIPNNINTKESPSNHITKQNATNNTYVNDDNKNKCDQNLNCEQEKINDIKKPFLNSLSEAKGFERGILYLTEEEFTSIVDEINSLGFRFIEIFIEKPKNERRNTHNGISKRHLNEIKNLSCSLSNNIYDTGKRKSKKLFERYYSKEELSSKEGSTNKNTRNNYNEEYKKGKLKEPNYANEKNNKSGIMDAKSNDNEDTDNKSTKKSEMNKNVIDNKNSKKFDGSLSNIGISMGGDASKCINKKYTKEASKKRQRDNNLNSDYLNGKEDEQPHSKTYKKRNYKTKNQSINYCLKILYKLKKKRSSIWFLKPVNPELDGVPNYLNVITYPMDFETIEKKYLIMNMIIPLNGSKM